MDIIKMILCNVKVKAVRTKKRVSIFPSSSTENHFNVQFISLVEQNTCLCLFSRMCRVFVQLNSFSIAFGERIESSRFLALDAPSRMHIYYMEKKEHIQTERENDEMNEQEQK